MKTTITFRGQDKPVVLDNIQVAQQRVPMYVVAQGDTRYRFSLDTIEKIVEEGVMSDPADVISASETDTDEPQADASKPRRDDAGTQSTKTPHRHTGAKKIDIDLSKLEGKLYLNEGKAGEDIRDGFSKGEIAARIQEILGVGQTQGYKIVEQLIAERKIRRSKYVKGNKSWDVVDPALNPWWIETIKDLKDEGKETFEEHLNGAFY